MGCERHLARGVRFNAEKKEIGKYYSTPILSFRMKCPSCSNWIEIHTDPQNSEYSVVSGAKRKNEEYSAEEAGIGGTRLTEEESEKLTSNPFFKLEHEARDQRRAKEQLPRLESLQSAKDAAYKDDWKSSQTLRKAFRERKRQEEAEFKAAEAFKQRAGGLEIKLCKEHVEDISKAKEVDFSEETKRAKVLRNHKSIKSLEDDELTKSKLKTFIKPK